MDHVNDYNLDAPQILGIRELFKEFREEIPFSPQQLVSLKAAVDPLVTAHTNKVYKRIRVLEDASKKGMGVKEFLLAAAPYIAIAVSLAAFFVRK